MTERIDKGRSILNATDEAANPYSLILSEAERNYIYAALNRLENMTSSLHGARTGWRPYLKATIISAVEFAIIAIVVYFTSSHAPRPSDLEFSAFALAFLILQKLNLLLTHEKIDQVFERRDREDKGEAAKRVRYFKETRTRDISEPDM